MVMGEKSPLCVPGCTLLLGESARVYSASHNKGDEEEKHKNNLRQHSCSSYCYYCSRCTRNPVLYYCCCPRRWSGVGAMSALLLIMVSVFLLLRRCKSSPSCFMRCLVFPGTLSPLPSGSFLSFLFPVSLAIFQFSPPGLFGCFFSPVFVLYVFLLHAVWGVLACVRSPPPCIVFGIARPNHPYLQCAYPF